MKKMLAACCLAPIACCLFLCAAPPMDLAGVVSGLERRYASVETVAGNFQQSYRAPGVDQVESGAFWLKKPDLMRWEYRQPEEQLFVADGRESSFYVPQDRQVTIQPLNASDLRNTPLELLLGSADINKNYTVSWESDVKPKTESAALIRLTPRTHEPAYLFVVLELDGTTFELRRVIVREPTGNTMEFLLSNVATNVKIDKKLFRFVPPKGVEEIRLDR